MTIFDLLTEKLFIIYVLFDQFAFTPTEPVTEVGMSHFPVQNAGWCNGRYSAVDRGGRQTRTWSESEGHGRPSKGSEITRSEALASQNYMQV